MRPNRSACRQLLGLLTTALLLISSISQAADWPTWRHDASRSAASPQQLAETLHLQWSRQLPASEPAWPEDPRLQFDAHYEPVVMGQRMFVASANNDSVTAYDTRTGKELWRFFADGPVRFAPVCKDGRVYFGADDGNFYCVDAETGKEVWTLRAAPANRKVIGNGRLISVWPMRGGPMLLGDKIHFTVGVWPFEGAFHYTVDISADDGDKPAEPRYTVKTLSDLTPQGYLAANDEHLFIPSGRAVTGCFNRETGKPLKISYASRGTNYHVSTAGDWLFHGNVSFHIPTRKAMQAIPHPPVFAEDRYYVGGVGQITAVDLKKSEIIETKDRRGKTTKKTVLKELWKLQDKTFEGKRVQVDLQAGNRLYGHAGTTVFAVELPEGDNESRVVWTAEIEGTPTTMLAADDRLFVVTMDDRLYAFGNEKAAPKTHLLRNQPAVAGDKTAAEQALATLKATNAKSGYCLAFGIGSGDLIDQVVRQSELQVIAIDSDESKVRALRERFDTSGLYGQRVTAMVGTPQDFGLPPYLAQLVISEDIDAADFNSSPQLVDSAFHVLRPYGGTACFNLSNDEHQRFSDLVAAAKPAGAELLRSGNLSLLKRAGALPGAADWTHEYGDAANTLMSRDKLVKPPLGVLWFGGPSADGSLFYNRHYWGPSMAVIHGRMFIQGPGKMTAVDVYTGRLLWQVPLKEQKDPRAGRRGNDFERVIAGFHFVAAEDAIYLVDGRDIIRLDVATGKQLAKFTHPDDNVEWGRIRLHGDLLIASVFRKTEKYGRLPTELIAMEKATGKTRWTKRAKMSFPVVALSDDKIFCFDGAMEDLYRDWARKGRVPKAADEKFVTAIDLKSGKELWKQPTDVIGTWLSYSKGHDVMLVSNKKQVAAFRGKTGEELWRKYSEGKGFRGHPENLWDKVIVWNNQVLDQRGPGQSYDLETGEPIMRKHPLTGEEVPWSFTKSGHHCNYAIASPHMMTFRAASAGYCDITTGSTSHLEGFRSGCRNSLIPADGVLNAPNFAHGCSCGYSLFTSLALVHVPQTEMWSYNTLTIDTKKQAIKRVGINFGAPGDRVDDNGTLWLEHPRKTGSSPSVAVSVTGTASKPFRKHAAQVKGDMSWVTASGIEGVEKVTIDLGSNQGKWRRFTVRLYFHDPEALEAGERVFDIAIQGKTVSKDFDLAKQSNGSNRGVMREFESVFTDRTLTVELKAKAGRTVISGVEVLPESFDRQADKKQYQKLVALRTEFRKLRAAKASPEEWQRLETKILKDVDVIVGDLSKRAKASKPRTQKLLFAARDYLPVMLRQCREQPNQVEEEFDEHLEFAGKMLEAD